ncbi:MAG: alpha/beta hydrolase [Rubrobacter sp.]|nr:alpha/beta hydrolase [Rubrobacter sp.]MDQ3302773.1 alpha/beta hydrolase [Actinomycetota bacterium]
MKQRPEAWRLGRRAELSGGEIAYEVFGDGPPVVLVHGTPSRSYIWRNVVPALANHFSVYVFDLLGFGDSERREGLDISIAAQSRLLAELIEFWQLEDAAIAGHDIGGGIVLRAHLLEKVPFTRIALIDAVVLHPWITPTTRHVKAHMDAYLSMPTEVFETIVTSHLRTATYRPMDEAAFEAYFSQWRGSHGQKLYLQKDAQLDEEHTAEFEPFLGSIRASVQIVWGECDAWLNYSFAQRLRETLPDSKLELIPDAGHFVMEDEPDTVARVLTNFFARERDAE